MERLIFLPDDGYEWPAALEGLWRQRIWGYLCDTPGCDGSCFHQVTLMGVNDRCTAQWRRVPELGRGLATFLPVKDSWTCARALREAQEHHPLSREEPHPCTMLHPQQAPGDLLRKEHGPGVLSSPSRGLQGKPTA